MKSEPEGEKKEREDNCVQLGIKGKAEVPQHGKPCIGELPQFYMFTSLHLSSSELWGAKHIGNQCSSQNASKCMSVEKHNDYIYRNRMAVSKHC